MLKEVLEYDSIINTSVTFATDDDKQLESHNKSLKISTLQIIKHLTFLITI